MTETEPISEKSRSSYVILDYRTMEKVKNPVMLRVLRHHKQILKSTISIYVCNRNRNAFHLLQSLTTTSFGPYGPSSSGT
jgi:hypothetical protein